MIKFAFLSENKTDNPPCMAEHGLAVYIEAAGKKLLFDTGASDLFLNNAKNLRINLHDVEALIISHGHYDHTEGVPAFCAVNSKAKIYLHKDSFGDSYGMVDGKIDSEQCGMRWTPEFKTAVMPRIEFTDGVRWLSEDVIISGTIPDLPGCAPTEQFYRKQEDGSYLPDSMSHEQFLIIRDRDEQGISKGLFLFSGCSHKGVIPVLDYAAKLCPGERIACLVAGMHLYSASEQMRQSVVQSVVATAMDAVMPVHCTGIQAICQLKQAMGDRCIVATAGDQYEW